MSEQSKKTYKAFEKGLKPDVWYALDENGKFVEVKE